MYLLNWRLWAGVAVLCLMPILYGKGRTDGRKIERAEHQQAVAEANAEARRMEQLRQSRADDAAAVARAREAGIRADADRARGAVGSLRDALAAAELRASESIAAADQRAAALGRLLAEGAEAHRELAERCDRHVNDVRMLLESWPR